MRRTLPWLTFAIVLCAPALAAAATSDGCSDFGRYAAQGWLWAFVGAFGAGFLTSLTPCVYPMIPITLAIFGARGGNVTKRRAIALAAAYVGGMCVTYTTLGVIVALIGKAASFGAQLANPFFVIPLAILFAALAASMFGAFDINLPSSWQARLNQVGGKGFGGAFAMGLVGGLIAAPCSGPFLTSLLSFVATTGDVAHGGTTLFIYGLGMGMLFFALAAFAMALPKSGRWMDAVKSIGGIALVVAALYYLMPLAPATVRHYARHTLGFLGCSVALVAVGVALGAVHLSFHGSWSERARKGLGVAFTVIGALGAWEWYLAPKKLLPYETDEVAAFAHARQAHKSVMVDFSAEWCAPCHEMEYTFGDDEVYDAITGGFVTLKFDVTTSTDADLAVRSKYGADTLPAVVFIDTEGNVLQRVRKLTEKDELLDVVRAAAAHDTATPCSQ